MVRDKVWGGRCAARQGGLVVSRHDPNGPQIHFEVVAGHTRATRSLTFFRKLHR